MTGNRKLRIPALALLIAICLCACGGNSKGISSENAAGENTTKDSGDTTENEKIPEAVEDPEVMEWGYNYDQEGNNDSQYWYPDGDKTQTTFLFFNDDNMTFVDGEERETIDTKVENKHVVDLDTEGQVFDFVFTDVFTCYDLVSGQWYMRSSYETAMKSLTASTFVCEAGDQWKITFFEDGTLKYDNDGKIMTGTWWFSDAYTVTYQYDEEDYTTWFWLHYEEDGWNIVSIEDTDIFYPEE